MAAGSLLQFVPVARHPVLKPGQLSQIRITICLFGGREDDVRPVAISAFQCVSFQSAFCVAMLQGDCEFVSSVAFDPTLDEFRDAVRPGLVRRCGNGFTATFAS